MIVKDVSRWTTPQYPAKSNAGLKVAIITAALILMICVYVFAYNSKTDVDTISGSNISSAFVTSDEATSENSGHASNEDLKQSVTYLASRVKALEAENHRIGTELDELIGNDGVINRLVSHIRSLHAQNEATRRDVVNALMAPMSENDQALGLEGLDPTLPVEGDVSPFLSKAKHTIVTPVATAPKAPKADEREVQPAKQKAKVATPEPDEGATN